MVHILGQQQQQEEPQEAGPADPDRVLIVNKFNPLALIPLDGESWLSWRVIEAQEVSERVKDKKGADFCMFADPESVMNLMRVLLPLEGAPRDPDQLHQEYHAQLVNYVKKATGLDDLKLLKTPRNVLPFEEFLFVQAVIPGAETGGTVASKVMINRAWWVIKRVMK